ncbi:palmitoyl-protein thioesterase 1 [Brassica rapa]|uniref:BnaA06g40130D protein n=1 Tax=Brassica napus TaxID=3708 RepID=A0A078JAU1_BRANA|nr:palmitoyl-protein thioesterase 1 [Brassica rapa]CDY64683.1 BnaA06g40130D [Brassica napus]
MEKQRFGLAAAVVFLALVQVSVSVPFIVLHGIAAACSEGKEANFTQLLSNFSGSPGFCLEVGNGELDSWFMPLAKQAEIACEKVKQMKELRQGYNIVGRSQGNLVARGLIEFCDGGPPVYNYVSLAGPHAGISSVPMCGSGLWCEIADELIKSDIYSDFIQDHLAPSGYLKIPTEMKKYLESSKYLPKLNNEIPNQRNSTYKERFASLHNLVLIKFEDDKVIVPKDSSWFGFYPDGDFGPLLTVRETKLFQEDWIGLKPLIDTGKVEFVSIDGAHLKISNIDIVKYVVPHLQNRPSSEQKRFNRKTKEPLHT